MKEVIDLTHEIHEGMTTYNAYWHPITKITRLGRLGQEGRETRILEFGSHTSTHMDAPRHFIPNGITIDQINIDNLLGPVTIANLREIPKNTEVTLDIFSQSINQQSLHERVLFVYGWDKYWGTKHFYKDHPFLSVELAKHLVKKGVKVVAMDSPTPDDSRTKLDEDSRGTELDSPIHKILLSKSIILVEYVANTGKIQNFKGWNIAALPLKITESDGSPCRVVLFKI